MPTVRPVDARRCTDELQVFSLCFSLMHANTGGLGSRAVKRDTPRGRFSNSHAKLHRLFLRCSIKIIGNAAIKVFILIMIQEINQVHFNFLTLLSE